MEKIDRSLLKPDLYGLTESQRSDVLEAWFLEHPRKQPADGKTRREVNEEILDKLDEIVDWINGVQAIDIRFGVNTEDGEEKENREDEKA